MPNNPFTNTWQFLTATTGDYLRLGNWGFLILALFWVLLIASIAVALQNLREDSEQRSGRHLGIWLVRVLIGCMWFQGMLWKLPLPVSDGLQYWTEQESTSAAFEFHRTFVKDVVLPHMTIFGPIVFLAELVFAASMMLGLAVRFVSVLAIAYVLQLWLGLYGNSSEWPWTYMFLALLMFLFAIEGAGRSLGLDAWLRRNNPAVRDGKGLVGWFFNIAG
ncbi:DoxX family protein [Bradyrhizobium sp. Ai1a-2]|uniref:DoxX family protein n=1 Tax=Bradyrhizobium sp. Ai1a-2 TaxID=196490 RepID=UPI00040EF4BB|nr:DoxX family protein [Bradyrhizobium sp. Ai1a-2]